MKNSLKYLGLISMICGLGITVSSCGGSKAEDVITIWGPEEHEQVYLDAFAKYKEAHPELNATVKFANLGDAGANGNVSKDVESAAEIITFPNDQLIDLRAMGALGKLPSSSVEGIKAQHYAGAVEAAKFGDSYYAYPVTADNGFVFIYNKDAFKGTSVWDATNNGLKEGYTFRDLYAALDERATQADGAKWANAKCCWPAGTAWYQCGMYFAVGGDYNVEFDQDTGAQIKSTCSFAYVGDGAERDYSHGLEAIRCMVNSYTNEDGTINKHFEYLDDSTYNAFANNNSKAEEFTKEGGAPLAGIVCWNNGNLLTNWGEDYSVEVLPTLEAKCAQYGGDGTRYTWRSFSGFKLLGVNPFSAYAKKSEAALLQLHDLALYLTGYDASIARYEANNAGPSNLQAREDERVKQSKFLTKLNEQFDRVDALGNPGYRTQDCVPQNFWTPIATLGNGVYNYVKDGQNAGQFKNETALCKELLNLQKSICQTV